MRDCARLKVSVQEAAPRLQSANADFSPPLAKGLGKICVPSVYETNLGISTGGGGVRSKIQGFCARFKVSVDPEAMG